MHSIERAYRSRGRRPLSARCDDFDVHCAVRVRADDDGECCERLVRTCASRSTRIAATTRATSSTGCRDQNVTPHVAQNAHGNRQSAVVGFRDELVILHGAAGGGRGPRDGRRTSLRPELAERRGQVQITSIDRPANGSTPLLQVAEDIVPIGALKAHLSERIRELRGRGRPLVVTQNGKAAAVLLAPEDFDRLTAQARFVAAVQEGLADHDAGRVISDEELGRRLDARFGALPKTNK